MKIVIDIPDDLVTKINNSDADDAIRAVRWYECSIVYAVKNGTVLPKGHGRLINADYIKLFSIDHDSWNGVEYEGIIKVVPVIAIDTAPTIIEADKGEE